MATEPFNLKVWSLHPHSSRVIRAEKTLNGTGHPGAMGLCAPYTQANKSGFWLFPPVDVDIMWKGGKEFEVRYHEEYDDSDYRLLHSLLLPKDVFTEEMWSLNGSGRSKLTLGTVEDGVVQMWTGNIFETPPGWAIHIRSPINCPQSSYWVMEGILETDFMQYDIWANIVFKKQNEWVEFRKNGWPPLAQLQPIRREGFTDKWKVTTETVNRDTPEANRVFEYWVDYNEKKFSQGGKHALVSDLSRMKDGTTFYKEKARCLGNRMEPKPEIIAPKGCPFHKTNKENRVVAFCVNDNAKYQKMCLNAIKMLREHNKTIPIKLIYIEGKDADFIQKMESLNVKIINKPIFRPETNYFPINKYWLHELEEDSVLYIDVDVFINGDVELLFEKYRTDITAIENRWAYTQDWKDEFFGSDGKYKYMNSGVQLFHGKFHRKIFFELSEIFDRLSERGSPITDWIWNHSEGWVREEVGFSLSVSENKANYSLFKIEDCYNIERMEDVSKCHEPTIFHTYTQQWELIKKWRSQRRKMVWLKPKEDNFDASF